ncbi:bifunctional folylpolyglutamate synthase/dihydrofolate synthase [Mesobacillus selenatarsenatis]|uniref:Dihydrofolate synthase/folylpolyglutamate synthase n=1 Tax=Mesobacillus selenatarsenatis (strain DSM 18680 / JCM 14380 / FERM P-15431 / SF-1) TaxID=1321606 RepID=A0A0A8WZ94_MESS1|nr:folylpolyglutamate synthase/dihydrofolate synthase family protein [Mesobacillus selenatarsenatis]GAM12077.1 dihydrofolate synthase /Folylpolyglutamate synthase [Mesobacillus selenatarsenatis SF-1]
MFDTYEQAIDWIHARLRLGIKPGLSRMEWMLERLDHPERRIKTIHIGGTNGKGSTVTFLRSILQSAGYRVGTFTSPYFEQFNERISINGQPINDQELIELTNVIKPLADELDQTELGGPTEFEVITAMSLYYFAKMTPVDVAIYEVGLGGRFDSTNVIHPLLSIITSIGLDHTAILGDTYEEIAFEKAGIIKNGVSVITGVKQPEALNVIRKKAIEGKSPLYHLGDEFSTSSRESLKRGEQFSFSSMFGQIQKLETSMIGSHQVDNAACAVMASQVLANYYSFMIDEEHIREGLTQAYWPGRLEILSENPLVLIDGAHNEEGINALAREINSRYADKKISILFAALKDKKLDKMIATLEEAADQLTFTTFDFPRAASVEELMEVGSNSGNKNIAVDYRSYLDKKINELNKDEILIVTGSLYFLSEAKPFIMNVLKNK